MITRLRAFLDNLSLRQTLALALLIGLAVPVGIAGWRTLTEQRTALLNRLASDHSRIVNVLALGMQTPLWEIRPAAGRPLIEALMLDERVTAITVSSPLLPQFLVSEAPHRRQDATVTQESTVFHNGEAIGRVRVEMDTGRLHAQLADQWGQILITGLVQLLTGLLIVFALLRYKVLNPLQRLVVQSKALAAGTLDRPLDWQSADELGVLGRSFEQMRRSLSELVADLEKRNRDLQERESELANQASILRAILDHMTDGVSLVDKNLRLVAWNGRFIDLLELPRERVRRNMPIHELIEYSLTRSKFDPSRYEAIQRRILASFQPDKPSLIRFHLPTGKRVDVRRQAVPDGGFVSTFTDVTEEVEARRKADEARHLLETVMDAVPAVIHVKDCKLRYQMVNRQFLDFWGLEREAVLGKTNREARVMDLSRCAEAREQQVIETGQPLPFYEETFDRGGAEPKTIWMTKVPLLDADGRFTHIVTVGLDISERKRVEQEHQRWLRLFQDAIESTRNGFAIYDAAHRLVICNSAFASLYGVSCTELVGTSVEDIRVRVLPMIQTFDNRPLGTMAETLERFRTAHAAPVEVQLKDGRWMLAQWHPTSEGGVVFIRTDITPLKKMEQALRESEQRFRSIAEAHPVPVVIGALQEERLLYVSPGLASLLQAPLAEIAAGSPRSLFPDPADWDRIGALLLEKGALDAYECRLRKADGTLFPVAITARRIVYLEKEAAVGGIIDLTESKRAEQEIARQREALHQSEKLNALGSLLAGVAHELNNPLSVVVGRAIMLEESAADPKTRTKIKKIRLAAERCAKIVKTFLAIARQQPPERAPVQLNSLIESAVELLGYALRTADIETTLELAPELPALSADADQLAQVFTNLIVNAQQALQEVPPPRRLAIATRVEPDAAAVRIEFTDNGPGVPAELCPRIFEPFYTSKPVGLGTGIGLSFSYGVIESHGGRLTLESPGEGGAKFVITLPITPAEPSTTLEGTGKGREEVRPQAVLIADDEPEIADMLGELLSQEGHRTTVVASGNAALKALADNAYDLIFSDLKMPDLDGPGLYQCLQQSYPHLLNRIVFITGDTLGLGASDFLARTGRPVLEKPFVPEDVLRVVRRVLERSN